MCDSNARLDGKVVIVTGGSSGVGYEAARNIAELGARVIIASRNETKLKQAQDKIQNSTGNNNVAYRVLDLGSLNSVRNFVSETVKYEKRIDVLINNAGAVALPDKLTDDGLNLTMQVNYFGAFLLTFLLLPLLKASAPSRVITGSAASMYIGEIDFDHWNDIGRYSAVKALANSKLADSLFSVELDRRLKGTRVTANSFDPFLVPDTNLLSGMPPVVKDFSNFFIRIIGQPKEEVGKQIAYLASASELEKVSGMHFKFCGKWPNHWLVHNRDLTKKLWDTSKKFVKITAEEDWESNSIYAKYIWYS